MQVCIASVTEQVTKILGGGGRILILGGTPTNFSNELRYDARFIFWYSTDKDTRRPKPVPEDTGLVLLTRFNGRDVIERVRKDCARIGASITGRIPPGQITNLLEDVIAELEEDKIEASAAFVAKTEKPDYSGLADFLIDQIPGDALKAELLESESRLAHLRDVAAERWPNISSRRVKRTLRQALLQLGVCETATVEPDDALAETATEEDEAGKITRLTTKVAELQREVFHLQRERRGFEDRRRKDRHQIAKQKQDLAFVLQHLANLTQEIIKRGLRIAIYENANERLNRIVEELTS